MASINDKITDVRNTARPNSARVSTARNVGATNLACDNLTGWPTASKVHFVTYQIDSNNNPIPATQIDCSGIVSASTITQLEVIDGTDAGNSIGDVVEMLPTAAWGQDLAEALAETLERTGELKDDIVVTAKLNDEAVTTAKIDDDAVTTAKILDDAVTTSKIDDGSVTYAKLLSTIFSGQVQSQVNAGTAGGTIRYVNLGGIKIVYGRTGTCSTSATPASFGVTFPTSFFSSVYSAIATIDTQGAYANQTIAGNSVSVSAMTTYITAPGAGGTAVYSYLVIGS